VELADVVGPAAAEEAAGRSGAGDAL